MPKDKIQLRGKMICRKDEELTNIFKKNLLKEQMEEFIESADIDFSRNEFAISVNYYEEEMLLSAEELSKFPDADDFRRLILDLRLINIQIGADE